MNNRPTSALQLSRERVDQIRELRTSMGGATASAAIGQLLAWAREQGHVPQGIPGLRVNAFLDGLAIAFDDDQPTPFSAAAASALAKGVREIAANGGALINLDADFGVSRAGAGVRVVIGATTRTFAVDVAQEFADLIDCLLIDA